MALTIKQRRENGRRIQEDNSGYKEADTCERFGLEQVGGSRTKVDGTHPDGSHWSIKNSKSKSTQVHLTSQEKFIRDWELEAAESEFVRRFFGNTVYTEMPRHRYTAEEINPLAVECFKEFLVENREDLIYYFVSGDSDITNFVYNGNHITLRDIMKQVDESYWVMNPTAIHLRGAHGKTLFHLQMKGSGNKAKMGYHGVLCHIHERLFQ
jgi:hypothetical protein